MRLGIAGIDGRMGQAVQEAALSAGHEVVIGLSRQSGPNRTTDVAKLIDGVDLVIDFTCPATTVEVARACVKAHVPLVTGVTGLNDSERAHLESASRTIPVFQARNFSIGIAALLAAMPLLVSALDGYDIEIIEMHHRHKADAPSGTALALAEAASANRSIETTVPVHGRSGVAPRRSGEIGIHAVRGGGNAGEHTVIFASEGDEVRLQHRALNRRAFADGAIRAAEFLIEQHPGFYGMADLVERRYPLTAPRVNPATNRSRKKV